MNFGKPNKGMIYDLKKYSKYKYKRALKSAALTADLQFDDKFHSFTLKKDINKFWKRITPVFLNAAVLILLLTVTAKTVT